MNREEFIGKLQACYFGDRNAFNEIVSVYDELNERINKAIEYTNHPWKFECSDEDCNVLIHNRKRFLLGILRGDKK